ncbi:hypothetical protein E6Q11_00480 [Candidatus Dojkabacteria bacterium]|uniref:Phage virion morphogenesis protein n=1 Tax=Candidatus Dojkabacteria bacterium TaxID=2099670 RepID=A0A5C7JB31_9BACT|nr:MAG: hypothetical protein E6Q11_00480 [Candidatus Dojkabacteria bacterium]
MILTDTFSPYLDKLNAADQRRLQAELARTIAEGIRGRQASQRDISGRRFKPRQRDYWAKNAYQEQRRTQPLFPQAVGHLRVEFNAGRLQVGFTGRAAELMAKNNEGQDAPQREFVGLSQEDLKTIAKQIGIQLSP